MQVLDSSMAHYLSSQGSPDQKNELDGSRQNIASIGTVEGLSTLRKLNLSFNPLNSLKNIDQFPNLRVLDVYACALSNVEDLRSNNKLEIIHFQQNKIKKIPFAFSNFIKLKELRLDHNHIVVIDNLNRCTGLVSLNLCWNNITSLDGISGLQSLTELRISNNQISSLKPLKSLPCLNELDVSHNQLTNLYGIQQLPTLQVLHAEHNLLTTVSIPQTFTHQSKLDVASSASSVSSQRNAGKEMDKGQSVLGMASLTDIFLGYNNIPSLDGLDRLGPNIEYLDICNNSFVESSAIIPFLPLLKKLKYVLMVGNPFSTNQVEVRHVITTLMKTCPSLETIDKIAVKKEENDDVDADVDIARSPEYKDKLRILKKSMTSSTDSDAESVDDINPDFEQAEERNEKRRAPKLSLKNLYTQEEVVFMEEKFMDLLNASKKTLKSIFHFPLDAEIPSAAGALGLDKTLKNLLKKKKKEEEDSHPLRQSQDLSSIKAAIDTILSGSVAGNVSIEEEAVSSNEVVSKRKDAALVDEVDETASMASDSVVGNTFIIETVADTSVVNRKSKIIANNSVTIVDSGLAAAAGSGLTRYGTKVTKPVIQHPSVRPEDQAKLQLLLSMTESSYASSNDSVKSSVFGNIKAERVPAPVIIIPSEIDDNQAAISSSNPGRASDLEHDNVPGETSNTDNAVKVSPLKASVGYDTRNRRSSDDNAKDYIISNIINTLRRHNSEPSPATPGQFYLTGDGDLNDDDSDEETSDAASYHEYHEENENLSPRYTPRTSTSTQYSGREANMKPNPGKPIVIGPHTQVMKPSNSLKSFRVSEEVKQLLGHK